MDLLREFSQQLCAIRLARTTERTMFCATILSLSLRGQLLLYFLFLMYVNNRCVILTSSGVSNQLVVPNNNHHQQPTINHQQQLSTTSTINNHQHHQPSTNNQQQPSSTTTIINNQQSSTINNNQQQSTTTNNNKQQLPRYDGHDYIRLGRRPGALKWVPGWCGGGRRGGAGGFFLDKTNSTITIEDSCVRHHTIAGRLFSSKSGKDFRYSPNLVVRHVAGLFDSKSATNVAVEWQWNR